MNQFSYKKLKICDNILLITLLIHDSPLNYIKELNSILKDKECTFIIDQYMYIQNETKRFIIGQYKGTKISREDLSFLPLNDSKMIIEEANKEVMNSKEYMSIIKIRTPKNLYQTYSF